MHKYLSKKLLLGLVLIGLAASGCLISGTFVIIEDIDFDFTANTGFYWYPVDLTGDPDWEDHEDDIDDIDALGMEFLITNNNPADCELNAWFVAASGEPDFGNPPTSIPSGAVQVITGLMVPGGATKKVTYQESLGFISNLEAFKTIVKSGRFDYYGTSCGGTDDDLFEVTEGKIIVTVSASGSGS